MIITTDLHLTNRERDEYRWSLFPWLSKLLKETDSSQLLILGDLTDEKDGHDAALVNRIVDTLAEMPADVTVLTGNHDYRDAGTPFFRFLNRVPNLTFLVEPTLIEIDGGHALCLPHSRQPAKDWEASKNFQIRRARLVFCHQTFDGALAGNGTRLTSGLSSRYFSKHCKYTGLVLSGDIHTPQTCGDVEYVGTPYPIDFGDNHRPRVVELQRQALESQFDHLGRGYERYDHFPPTIRKLAMKIADPNELTAFGLKKGDQLKVTLTLNREEFADWEDHRKQILAIADEAGASVHSVDLRPSDADARNKPALARSTVAGGADPRKTLAAFCEARRLSEGERFAAEDVLDRLDP